MRSLPEQQSLVEQEAVIDFLVEDQQRPFQLALQAPLAIIGQPLACRSALEPSLAPSSWAPLLS